MHTGGFVVEVIRMISVAPCFVSNLLAGTFAATNEIQALLLADKSSPFLVAQIIILSTRSNSIKATLIIPCTVCTWSMHMDS
jgi:hypothetical protein